MKKVLLILISLIILSGCTIKRVDNLSFEEQIDDSLSLNINHYNKIGNGYKYYAPIGIIRVNSNSYNDVLKRKDIKYYLYVDIVSYYYKKGVDYKEDKNIYFSKKINNGSKQGYIEVIEMGNDNLYVKMVYNYAKIESYIPKKKLNDSISDICYILSSVKFNDSLLEKMYEEGKMSSKEEVYYLFDSKEKDGNFIEYIKEYDKYDETDAEDIEAELIIEKTTTTKASTTTIETTVGN